MSISSFEATRAHVLSFNDSHHLLLNHVLHDCMRIYCAYYYNREEAAHQYCVAAAIISIFKDAKMANKGVRIIEPTNGETMIPLGIKPEDYIDQGTDEDTGHGRKRFEGQSIHGDTVRMHYFKLFNCRQNEFPFV